MTDQAVPGKKIRRLPADQWNDMAAAGRAFREGRLSQGNEGGGFDYPDPGFIKIRNDTGSALPRFSIVGIGDPWTTPSSGGAVLDVFKTRKTCVAAVPAESHRGKFAILVDGCAPGGVVDAIASGVVQCQIEVDTGEEDYEWADIEPGSTNVLHAATSGSARILWKESGTGTKWAQVRLSNKPPAASTTPTVFLLGGASYNSDGSNRNLLKGYGDGYSSDDRVGYLFFDYQYGDASGVGLTIETNKTSVDSGSNAETSPLFSLSTTGLYLINLTVVAYDQTTIPAATSSNVTSGTNSAGSPSHTHDVARLTDVQYQSKMTASIQSRVGAGAWSTVQGRPGTTLFRRTGTISTYVYDCMHVQFLIANSTAGKEYRIKLATDIYPQLTLADPADHAERYVLTDSGSNALSIMRVFDDPTATSL